jgi:signal transduction histidine kinase
LQGLFVLLSLAICYLASARSRALESASREVAEHEQTIVQLEELLSMVSHDMRSPLNALKLSLYTLNQVVEDKDARLTKPLAVADRQIARILSLVDRLLEPSKMEARLWRISS